MLYIIYSIQRGSFDVVTSFSNLLSKFFLFPIFSVSLMFVIKNMPPASNTPVTQKKKQVTKSAKAGLIMPVARFRNNLKKGLYAEHIGIGSAVYMAAVLEYLIAEVSELSGNAASDKKRRRINPRHITMAVRNDSELDKLFRNVIISEGGVLPVIHRELLPKASKKNVKSLGKDSEEL